MADERDFRLRLIESKKAYPADHKHDRATRAKPETNPRAVLRSLKATLGADEILDRVPDFGDVAAWKEIAYFSVCRKSGSARWLDLWDADHFDGFTDMPVHQRLPRVVLRRRLHDVGIAADEDRP